MDKPRRAEVGLHLDTYNNNNDNNNIINNIRKHQQQQLELEDSIGMMEASERQLLYIKEMLERSEGARADAEMELASKERELQSLKKQTLITASSKILEGKISALQEQKANMDAELKICNNKRRERENDVKNKDIELLRMAQTVQERDRVISQSAVVIEGLERDIARLKKVQEDSSQESKARRIQTEETADRVRALESEIEVLRGSHKDELRAMRKSITTREHSEAALRDKIRESEGLIARYEADTIKHRDAIIHMETEYKDTCAKLEAAKARGVQDSIIITEMKRDGDQARCSLQSMRLEMCTVTEQNMELKRELGIMQEEQQAKYILEANLQSAIQRQREEAEQLAVCRDRLEEMSNKYEAALKETGRIPLLEARLSDQRTLVGAKEDTIAMLQQQELSLQTQLREASEQLKEANEGISKIQGDNYRLELAMAERNRQAEELQEEVKRIAVLQGEVGALHDIVRDNKAQLEASQRETQQWMKKSQDLDSDVDTLLQVKNQFEELVENHRSLYYQLEAKTSEMGNLQKRLDDTQDRLAMRECDVKETNIMLMDAEDQMERLRAQLEESNAIESNLRKLSAEMTSVRHELDSVREKKEEYRLKALQKEEQYQIERQGRVEAEERIVKTQEDCASDQIELGKCEVRIELMMAELRRNAQEIENNQMQIETLQGELAMAQRTVASVTSEANEVRYRDNQSREEVRKLTSELVLLQDTKRALQLANGKLAVLDSTQEQLHKCESKLSALTHHSNKLETDLIDKSKMLNDASNTIQQLQEQITSLERSLLRHKEAKEQAEKQLAFADTLEKEDADKSKLLMEKEREISRYREKVSMLTADIDTERTKHRALESRIRELQGECEKVHVLEGQVSGLQVIIQQRNLFLEEERANNEDLRVRLGRYANTADHRQSVSRSRSKSGRRSPNKRSDVSVYSNRERVSESRSYIHDDTKKDEIIQSLHMEGIRKQRIINDLLNQESSVETAPPPVEELRLERHHNNRNVSTEKTYWVDVNNGPIGSRDITTDPYSNGLIPLVSIHHQEDTTGQTNNNNNTNNQSNHNRYAHQSETRGAAGSKVAGDTYSDIERQPSMERADNPNITVEEEMAMWRERRRLNKLYDECDNSTSWGEGSMTN